MPLFRENPVRSTAAAIIGLVISYFITSYMSSPHAIHLTQTTVAILAISALMFLVTMHHRREGHLLTQQQEEMVLIVGFALFWMAALLAWRALSQNSGLGDGPAAGSHGVGNAMGRGGRRPSSGHCGKDDIYCIIEEYYYY